MLDALVGETAQPGTRESFRKRLRSNELNDKEIEVEVTAGAHADFEIPGSRAPASSTSTTFWARRFGGAA